MAFQVCSRSSPSPPSPSHDTREVATCRPDMQSSGVLMKQIQWYMTGSSLALYFPYSGQKTIVIFTGSFSDSKTAELCMYTSSRNRPLTNCLLSVAGLISHHRPPLDAFLTKLPPSLFLSTVSQAVRRRDIGLPAMSQAQSFLI